MNNATSVVIRFKRRKEDSNICGIVYSESFDGKPVNNAVMQQYDKQRNRGVQGFGIFDGQELNMVHETKEKKILNWLVKYDSNLLLMHHRFPTSTANVKKAAHPFSTKDYFGKNQYILVHNGVIRNPSELFADHAKLDIEYQSLLSDLKFNDSEALMWDLALCLEGKQKEMKAYGSIAFICLKLTNGKLTTMYFGRNNGNPLNMLRTKEGMSLSSEGEGEAIAVNTLHAWNYAKKRLTKKEMRIPQFDPNYKYTPSTHEYKPSGGTANSGFKSSPRNSHSPKNWQDELIADYDDYNEGYDWDCPECLKYQWACGEHYTPFPEITRSDADTKDNDDVVALRNVLARQFGTKFMQSSSEKTPIVDRGEGRPYGGVEYEQDPDTQMMLPVGVIQDKAEASKKWREMEDRLNLEEQERAARESTLNRFSDEEILQEFYAYIAAAKGNFEVAYWNLEADYYDAERKPANRENIRALFLIEKVMERLQDDEEYINERSVSSLWRETQLATA